MSSLTRWNGHPLSMSEAIDRLFDQAFVMPGGNAGFPSIDLVENADNLVVKAEMPGFTPENVDIRVEGNVLTLRGDYNQENENNEGEYHFKERRTGNFARSLTLPVDVNADKAQATFENGVLTLTLPKSEAAKPKRISIKPKSSK